MIKLYCDEGGRKEDKRAKMIHNKKQYIMYKTAKKCDSSIYMLIRNIKVKMRDTVRRVESGCLCGESGRRGGKNCRFYYIFEYYFIF